jgi:hypothetical protein
MTFEDLAHQKRGVNEKVMHNSSNIDSKCLYDEKGNGRKGSRNYGSERR